MPVDRTLGVSCDRIFAAHRLSARARAGPAWNIEIRPRTGPNPAGPVGPDRVRANISTSISHDTHTGRSVKTYIRVSLTADYESGCEIHRSNTSDPNKHRLTRDVYILHSATLKLQSHGN